MAMVTKKPTTSKRKAEANRRTASARKGKKQNSGLTKKQRDFVKFYILTGNAGESVKRAGYNSASPAKYGDHLLNNEKIKQEINQSKIDYSRVKTVSDCLEFLTNVINGKETETIVLSTPKGIGTAEREADIKTKLTAVKQLLTYLPTPTDLTMDIQLAQLGKIRNEKKLLEEKVKLLKDGDLSDKQGITIQLDGAPDSKEEDSNNES